jgi:hypothetical protein
MTTVSIKHIKVDAARMGRVTDSKERIDEYAELMEDGAVFPPVKLFYDGVAYFLADGWHRVQASIKAGFHDIRADIERGTERDAQWYALGANKHGLNRTIADKRQSVQIILDDVQWVEKADREIARHCAVSHTFVSNMRAKQSIPEPETQAVAQPVATKGQPVEQPNAGKTQPNAGTPQPNAGKTQVDAGKTQAETQAVCEHHEFIIQSLTEENEGLTKKLALATLPPEDRDKAAELIDELREEVNSLRIELDALRNSRDTYQRENAQLKKQVAAQQRRLKELEK